MILFSEAGRRGGLWPSRMQTAALLLDLPLPRRMASRPVDWMAVTTAEGAVVPLMWTSWEERSAETVWMPGSGRIAEETDSTQESQSRGTAKVVCPGELAMSSSEGAEKGFSNFEGFDGHADGQASHLVRIGRIRWVEAEGHGCCIMVALTRAYAVRTDGKAFALLRTGLKCRQSRGYEVVLGTRYFSWRSGIAKISGADGPRVMPLCARAIFR